MHKRVLTGAVLAGLFFVLFGCGLFKEPVAFFEAPEEVIVGETFTLDASGTTGAGEYWWDFGDGTRDITTTTTVDHEYEKEGEYTVQLKARSFGFSLNPGDPGRCHSRTIKVVAPGPPPTCPVPVAGIVPAYGTYEVGESISMQLIASAQSGRGYDPVTVDWVHFTLSPPAGSGLEPVQFRNDTGPSIPSNGVVEIVLSAQGTWNGVLEVKGFCETGEGVLATASCTFIVKEECPPCPPPECKNPALTVRFNGQTMSASAVPEVEEGEDIVFFAQAEDKDSCLPCGDSSYPDGIRAVQITVRDSDNAVVKSQTFSASTGSMTVSDLQPGIYTVSVLATDDDCQARTTTFHGQFRVIETEPPPPPPVDPCDMPPVVDVPVSSEYPNMAINFQLVAYQPNVHSGGYHPEDMRRVIVVFEKLASHEVVANFDTWEQQPNSRPIPANGRLLVSLSPGEYQVRGIGWNMCDTCPVNRLADYRIKALFGIKSVPGGLTCEFAHNFRVVDS